MFETSRDAGSTPATSTIFVSSQLATALTMFLESMKQNNKISSRVFEENSTNGGGSVI